MITKVVVLGAGAHAAEIQGYIKENNLNSSNQVKIIGFYDDNKENWKKYELKAPLLGGVKDHVLEKDVHVLLGIANVTVREKLIEFYLEKGVSFANFIHYTAFVFDTANIGIGNVICRNCVIGPNVKLGNYNTLNTNASLGHDSVIGNNNILCPNVGFSGSTNVGNNNFFSLNSTTVPQVSIGDNNIIAPNMTIEKNIKNNSTFFHRFKEKVLFQPK